MNRNLQFSLGLLLLVIVAVLVVVLNRQPNSVAPKDTKPNNSGATRESKVRSPIKSDEEIVFYPAFGWRRGNQETPDYEIEIRGCIFEAGRHAAGVKLIRELTGIDERQLTSEEARLFQQRAELFAVDHERDKAIPIRIGERIHTLPKSGANGQFEGQFIISSSDHAASATNSSLSLRFEAVLQDGDQRIMSGSVRLFNEPPAVHVISDIDDTIKISEVRDKPALLMNTFCRPFRPVPGMADLYRSWNASDVCFHYVSASPWQLYPPLSEFIREHKFPSGPFHMKHFRLQDRTALNLFGSQEEYKRGVIEPLLKKFPKGRFVLVGDSGEQDHKIYAGLFRDYPEQVAHIFIRNATDEPPNAFDSTFADVPKDRWQVFLEPSEINFKLKSEP